MPTARAANSAGSQSWALGGYEADEYVLVRGTPKIKPDVAARLMRHAYALTMANAHVLLGYPLLTIPEPARFAELTR